MTSVGEDMPRQMARVRDEMLPVFDGIPGGAIAALMMRAALDEAAAALAQGDIVRVLLAYEQLKGFES